MRQINQVFKAVLGLSLVVLTSACSIMTREHPLPNDPAYAPVPSSALKSGEMVTGSIYQVNRNFSMYGDQVALNVGDILTVTLQENTSSSKSADTSYDKDDEVTFNEATILGNVIQKHGLSLLTNPSLERAFDGKASSDQSNSLSGSISVTVSEVLPNGILRIQGEKWLRLNQGDEYIRLTGLVRPQDIGTDNTIPSSKVADARIAYGGTGDFDDVNRQGWLSRFFNSEWWFM
ncbi:MULTISPECIES: flagellar basal body L-ring protein FlgH [unclassified Oleiphilus]|uniref:flagellar basal body L-ring protein FlgH n=3 Tax=Oleiphilus TaxID=141450 RepID=UPI0007C35C0E|nr:MULTISPECIES: flagellar basal body L-ring protein FlgH [unclassified Oleiphilus]KZY45572.1 flagellar basal body L-ring protein [Oleiphilus sp. HI0050]KZY76064.1 flagellar basal body L-ring protein [Oleiphilus sp. HI0068]KZY76253.1 flagellar basal body L-ring protein [Oleiphilus sp. HI0069]KZY96854.1 flagellar basal body L-ring protein [Oleiphilus sp. HI0072]KZZ12476.1 flagellar basal body L-ring protein [Oleiphilus sp. HI0078]KZZ31116.1 flagellar basal body L-ring protein [Oleiphilus sp. H